MIELVPEHSMVSVGQDRRDRFGGEGWLGGSLPSAVAGSDGRARVLNEPARIDITVLEPITYAVVARTLSRPDGSWRVQNLNTALPFTIVGTDRGRQVNSAIQDWIYPAPMAD